MEIHQEIKISTLASHGLTIIVPITNNNNNKNNKDLTNRNHNLP
jgi:hypothetical protein